MKRLILLSFFAFSCIGIERLCHRATDGFAIVNVYAPPGNSDRWHREEPLPKGLAEGPFSYFDSGSQSYVFLSADGKTILKLFKFQHMRTPPFLNLLPDWGKLGEKRKKKRDILEKTFDSLTLAYEMMKEEAGLLYLHLSKTSHLNTEVTLIDKIGRKHHLDLDSVEFVLQKRGTLAYSAIDHWMKGGEEKKAQEGISALLRLAASRCQKGLFDKDPDFSTNFGFIETIPFQIDVGRLSRDPLEADPKVYAPEMIRITRAFENWIAKQHPTLLPQFLKEIDAITAQ